MSDFSNDLLFLKEQINISSSIDGFIEECQYNKYSLKISLKHILQNSIKLLNATSAFVFTYDEEIEQRFFFIGEKELPQKYNLHEYVNTEDNVILNFHDKTVFIQPIDISGNKIGITGFVFDKINDEIEVEKTKIRVNLFCEELDNFLFNINHERIKQNLIKHLNNAIRKQVLTEGIVDAIKILSKAIDFKKVVLIYFDSTEVNISYQVFEETNLIYDNSDISKKYKELDRLILLNKKNIFIDTRNLTSLLNFTSHVEFDLVSGKINNEIIGKIIVESNGNGFNTYSKDLIHVFSQIVNYRIVDFNREQKILRRSFSKDVTSQLLQYPDYIQRYLTPRVKDVVIMFSDINSFTKISEQIFVEPELLGKFINKWSTKALEIIFNNGGVFDKMVGDCIIALFGPPFFDKTKEEYTVAALKATYELLEFTISLEDDPEFSKIKTSNIVKGLGIATGINYAPLNVGLFGHHEEYTGFSSGMNNTARLQSVATFRETYIMEHLKEYVESMKGKNAFADKMTFGDIQQASVKNVSEPLKYYKVNF